MSKFENRISPIKFALLIGIIGNGFKNQEEAIKFYNSILDSPKNKLVIEAILIIKMEIVISQVSLKLKDAPFVTLTETLVRLQNKEEDTINESVVFSKYYYALATYRKVCNLLVLMF